MVPHEWLRGMEGGGKTMLSSRRVLGLALAGRGCLFSFKSQADEPGLEFHLQPLLLPNI